MLYGGGGASIQNVLDALENIGSSFVRVAINAETDNYEGELHWQSAVKFTNDVLLDLQEMRDAVNRGDIDDGEGLRVLTESWLEVNTQSAIAVSFANAHDYSEDYG